MSVTVIVPAHNEEQRIVDTLDSILTQTRPPERLFVVDDASTDKTYKVVQDWHIKNLSRIPFKFSLVRSDMPQGSKAKAQNFALFHESVPVVTKYVIAIDSDTTLDHDALEHLVNAMERTNAAGACSWVIPKRQTVLWNKARTLEYTFAFIWFKRVQSYIGRPAIISGCLNIFKTKTLKWLGGYPEYTLAEDMDLTSTIYQLGAGKGIFVKEAIARTDDPETLKDMKNQLDRWSCAYFQNVRRHLRNLWKYDRKVATMMTVGLVDGMFGSMFYPLTIAIGYFWGLLAMGLFLIADSLTISLVAMYGARRFGLTWKIVTYLPYYFVLRVLNTYYHLKWAILGGIFGKSIKSYIKGH